MGTTCKNCGQDIEQVKGMKTKKYCTARCRRAYYHKHPREINRKYIKKACGNCGQIFESYENAGRIYCSLTCYREMRYVKKGHAAVCAKRNEAAEIIKLPAVTGFENAASAKAEFLPGRKVSIVSGAGDFPVPRRIWLVCGATWFSGKIDHFAALVPMELSERLLEADAFVFCNRGRDLLSLLQWQGDGFALYYKRLEYGKYPWPKEQKGERMVEIAPTDFMFLLAMPDFLARCDRGDFSPLEKEARTPTEMLF